MKPPPLFLAACAALWGFETGHWIIGGVMALVAESHRVIRTRWDLSTEDIRKLATICNVILLLTYIYLAATGNSRSAMPMLIQWLPLVLLPLLAAAQYSMTGDVNPAALFMMLRRRARREGRQPQRIRLDYPFAALLVLGAGAANQRNVVYYAGVALIAAWALWTIRPRRYSPALWGAVLVFVAGTGFAAQIGLNHFQHWLVEAAVQLIAGTRTDPYQHTTDLGHIGTLKLSNEILMRVEIDRRQRIPLLLHRASYNDYVNETWLARGAPLQPVEASETLGLWRFSDLERPAGAVTVTSTLEDGIGVLALPRGTAEMHNPSIIEMKLNRLGTIRAVGDPGLMRYAARIGAGSSLPGAPDEQDLDLPAEDRELLQAIANRLGLASQTPAQAIATVEAYFAREFRYSLYQEGSMLESPLADFLTTTRAGHCEYFATATTLLLRAAGIPARYATGFSVQEYSDLEELYLVRLRHAHSWARAYVDSQWRDVDTTPAAWFVEEEKTASPLEPLMDWFSWAWHRYSLWMMESGDSRQQWVLLLAIPLIGYLLWRMRGPRRKSTVGPDGSRPEAAFDWPGLDSELLEIEAHLRTRGLGRGPGETTAAWIRRLCGEDRRYAGLQPLLALHYRQRFSDGELPPEARSRLTRLANEWLENDKRSF